MSPPELPPPLRALPGEAPAAGTAAATTYLRGLGLEPIAWSNAPGDRYAGHQHPFTKLLMCAEGSITFLVGEGETRVELGAGDGFEMPPATRHAAIVGDAGCTCVEAHRP